jgi:hypothetical protein
MTFRTFAYFSTIFYSASFYDLKTIITLWCSSLVTNSFPRYIKIDGGKLKSRTKVFLTTPPSYLLNTFELPNRREDHRRFLSCNYNNLTEVRPFCICRSACSSSWQKYVFSYNKILLNNLKLFLISNFRRVLNVLCFLLSYSPASPI